MPFIKFLKDKLGIILLSSVFFILTCLILWLTPSVHFSVAALSYLALLDSLALLAYLILAYLKRLGWFNALKKQSSDNLFSTVPLRAARTQEQQLAQIYINDLKQAHQKNLDQLITMQHEQKDFIDSWVHEIKLPLASVKLISNTIDDTIDERYSRQLENDLQTIERYVEQVLYYSRLDSFSKDYLIQEVSLKHIILPLIRQNANYFIQHNLHYIIDGPDVDVLTDQKWLAFILNQIISNAIKYTPDNGSIKLSLAQNERGAWLTIADNGIGIPLADQQRIFDKGFTGQTGRNQHQRATGLGLYLAKSLITKLGHHIYVESIENSGTTISILFPYLTYYTAENEEALL